MKRLCLILYALLLTYSSPPDKYYVFIMLQDGSYYEEYMTSTDFKKVVDDFCRDSNYESLFFAKEICVTDRY